jgi:hypothetical protein
LQCWPVNPLEAPPVIESPPVSIVTAPTPVRRGDVVRIHGWLRVPRPIHGSRDGVIVADSLAGACLALRAGESIDWREFVLYRAAARDEDVTVTFALSGMGEAWLDDITMTVLQQVGPAAALPAEPTWGDRRQRESVPLAR